MKKLPAMTIQSLSISLSVAALCIFSACNSSKKEETTDVEIEVKALINPCPSFSEEPLDLTTHPVPISSASVMINLTHSLIVQPASQNYNIVLKGLTLNQLNQLKAKSCDLSSNCNDTYKVTGIKLWYAIKSSGAIDSLKCYFEPVFLCSSDQDKVKTYKVYPKKHDLPDTSNLYYFENENLKPCTSDHINEITAYRNKIQFIECQNSTNPRSFVNTDDPTGDTKAVLFTFQELDNIMIDNTVNSITLFSMASFDYYSGKLKVQHSIICAPGSYKFAETMAPIYYRSFKDMLGNHANPCPPHCDDVVLKSI